MFRKILVANRGEIACRIIKTARRVGVRTVAVCSSADAGSRHARLADEAVLIGPPEVGRSYLAIERIIDAAEKTGAEAVHPGYGFLAENADFAEACGDAGLVFVGPPSRVIRAMGSKSLAKAIVERVNVPLVPGYHGETQEAAFLRSEATRIGYPLLVKATAGGGGKGMRTIDRAEQFVALLGSCQREASAAFGDARVLLERYVPQPRHVEIQVFADSMGNAVHLFERDCSTQRRHQKVVEEAPAPGVTEELRSRMAEAALAVVRAVGYVGAGTVEFIVDREGAFYFVEMNTRLQVEHAVTEMVTGLDLVEWQLRAAAGERLPLRQEDVTIRGHAMEARVYAEDPSKGFLPSTGRLSYLTLPLESREVRIDRGVDEGDDITPYYDPLLAKLVVWGEDRERARARLRHALAELHIAGLANNVAFLSRLVESPAFVAEDLSTDLIERERHFLFPPDVAAPNDVFLVAALAVLLSEPEDACAELARDERGRSPWNVRDGWRLNSQCRRDLTLRIGKTEKTVRVLYAKKYFELEIDGKRALARGELGPHAALRLELDGTMQDAAVVMSEARYHLFLDGREWQISRLDPMKRSVQDARPKGNLVAPMPGRIVALLSEPGAWVEQRTPLLVLEAMKMEHTVTAPCAGVLKAFHFRVGDQVTEGAELVEFEAH